MNNLIAKPIIKDQYWVVTDGEKKVGNVLSKGTGFDLKINGIHTHFETEADIKKKTKIRFQPLKTNKTKADMPYPEYPTTKKVYNSVFDIKRKLHLFTKTTKSKCFYVAGWFVIDQNGNKQVSFCPKYIFIQRYPYQGPFKSQDEANSSINNA